MVDGKTDGDRRWPTRIRWTDALALALFVPLVVGVLEYGVPRGSAPWLWLGDPGNFVRTGLAMADGRLPRTRDPPFRYVPFAVVIAVTGAEGAAAARISATTAAVFSFVLTPLAVWVAARVIANPRIALASLGLVVLLRIAKPFRTHYESGSWHYEVVAPFVILAVAAAYVATVEDSRRRREYAAVAAGVAVGFAGVTQLTSTALAIVAIVAGYAHRERWRELAITGVVGAPFLTWFAWTPDVVGYTSNRTLGFFAFRWAFGDLPAVVLGHPLVALLSVAPLAINLVADEPPLELQDVVVGSVGLFVVLGSLVLDVWYWFWSIRPIVVVLLVLYLPVGVAGLDVRSAVDSPATRRIPWNRTAGVVAAIAAAGIGSWLMTEVPASLA